MSFSVKRKNKDVLWRTSDGREIEISKMDTSHIKNCINKIKKSNWRVEYLPFLKEELDRRFLTKDSINLSNLLISESEMEYFLMESEGFNLIKVDILSITDDPADMDLNLLNFIRDNSFYIDNMSDQEFLEGLRKDIKETPFNYGKYNKLLLENKFAEIWERTISILLGRGLVD